MPKRLVTLAEQRHIERLVEACFARESELERLESVSAQYDTEGADAERITDLTAARAELKGLLEQLLSRLA